MASHIFAKNIRTQLEGGARRITVPRGARLSPSAADLIKEYGAEVVFADVSATGPEPGAKPAAAPSAGSSAGAAAQVTAAVKSAAGPTATDADVDRILERVLARLAESKDEKPEPGADDEMIICRCEEITKGKIREAIASGMATLNGIKRVTRAGMGLCQGQTCQRLVTQLLCQELGLNPADVRPISDRPPTRPIPLKLLSTG